MTRLQPRIENHFSEHPDRKSHEDCLSSFAFAGGLCRGGTLISQDRLDEFCPNRFAVAGQSRRLLGQSISNFPRRFGRNCSRVLDRRCHEQAKLYIGATISFWANPRTVRRSGQPPVRGCTVERSKNAKGVI